MADGARATGQAHGRDLGDDLGSRPFAVIDVETSGLSPRWHRILQIAIVRCRGDGTVIDEWTSDVRPRLWHVGPRNVHGLTVRRLRRAPRFAGLVPDVIDRLDGTVLAAHNASFDWDFLRASLHRAGYRPPDARRLCTLNLSRALNGAQSHRLADLCAHYEIALTNAHDALADARATAALLPHLLAQVDGAALTTMPMVTSGSTTSWPRSLSEPRPSD